ncbi:MAG: hypothetical protein LBR61_09905 [Synergistaceae bacterium]|jgi:hypothetical protein|nr:hypothetical protein [Synergistaceae bacterium]
MEIRRIVEKLDDAWQDVSLTWRDDLAARFKNVVIDTLGESLRKIEKLDAALEQAMETASRESDRLSSALDLNGSVMEKYGKNVEERASRLLKL